MNRPVLTYQEIRPPESLRDLVECAWSLGGSVPPGLVQTSRVLPDGCMDIVFDFGAEPSSDTARGAVVGTMTRAEVFHTEGDLDVFGVRFLPGGAPRVLGTPAHELTDGSAELSHWAGSEASFIVERLAHAGGFADRARILWRFLAERASGAVGRLHVIRAADVLMHAHQDISMASLADEIGVSRRTVERAFTEEVGISPKLSARIGRFRRAVNILLDFPDMTLGRAAHASGYFDQSHFNREFRAFAGLSPSEWKVERVGVASVQATDSVIA